MDKSQHFKFQNPEDIYDIALSLSQSFPDSERSMCGIYELLMNAVEHGNLNIGFDVKTVLLRYGIFHDEIRRRLTLGENSDKYVEVDFQDDWDECHLTITDSGHGFDWKSRIQHCTSQRQFSPHGRGLLITMHSGFSSIVYNDIGNSVTIAARKVSDLDIPHIAQAMSVR